MAKEIIPALDADAGYFVEADDVAMLLTVHYPKAALQRAGWRGFVSDCHKIAGDLGFGIEFLEHGQKSDADTPHARWARSVA